MDGAPHDRYLELVVELHRAGKLLAAQLGWMQARMIYDPDDQDALYASLFAKPPAIAREMSARSAAAMLERSFRLATSKAATDRLHLAFEITEHVSEAMTDVKGQRRAKFVEATDRGLLAPRERADREEPRARGPRSRAARAPGVGPCIRVSRRLRRRPSEVALASLAGRGAEVPRCRGAEVPRCRGAEVSGRSRSNEAQRGRSEEGLGVLFSQCGPDHSWLCRSSRSQQPKSTSGRRGRGATSFAAQRAVPRREQRAREIAMLEVGDDIRRLVPIELL